MGGGDKIREQNSHVANFLNVYLMEKSSGNQVPTITAGRPSQ